MARREGADGCLLRSGRVGGGLVHGKSLLGLAIVIGALDLELIMSVRTNPEDSQPLAAELKKLRAESEKLKRQLDEANKKLRKLPIELKFKAARFGAGQVLEMYSQSTEKLTVTVRVFRPIGNASQKFKRVLPELPVLRQDPTEIGHAEGWAFAYGDEVEISSDGFDPIKVIVL